MNKIKTVKIKNLDGSISQETYTIAVDAKNVDMDNDKDLQDTIGNINVDTDGNVAEQLDNKINKIDIVDNLESTFSTKVLSANQGKVLGDAVAILDTDIKKKVYYFNNVAEMKVSNLKANDVAITMGYYEANDGGSAIYKIVDSASETELQESLDNNKYANLVLVDNVINIKQLGARGNNSTDDTTIIQKAINTGKSIFFPSGNYLVSSLDCNDSNINIRGNGRSTTTLRAKTSDTARFIDAENNNKGFIIRDITIDGNNKASTALYCGDKNISFTSKNRMLIDNISVINCTGTGIFIGNTSCTCNNVNIVFCHDGIVVEGYGAIVSNSVLSRCEDYGLKLYRGNGYVTNNKIYRNGNGIFCDGFVFSVDNNNIQQNENNGLVLGDDSNSNTFNNNIFVANGYYTENQTPPSGNYEIILNGDNNSIKDCIVIPFITEWESKRTAIIQNVKGFNNDIDIILSRSLTNNNALIDIGDINTFADISGYNISNYISINNEDRTIQGTSATVGYSDVTGADVTQTVTDNKHLITLSNATIGAWDKNTTTGLQGSSTRFTPSTTQNVNGLYVTFERELSQQLGRLGIGEYLQYSPTGGNLTPVNSLTNLRKNYNPMTKKEKLILYVFFDEPVNVNYFQIANRFLNLNSTSIGITELVATISNVKYYVF